MGLFSFFQTAKSHNHSGGSAGIAIVDGDSFMENGRRRPADQVDALRRLADFAQREGFQVTAAFAGRPLREVAEGGDYRGVKVHFAEESHELPTLIARLADQTARRGAVVISSDQSVRDRVTASGILFMSSSTLRKALEASLGRTERRPRHGHGGGNRNGRGRGRRRDAQAPAEAEESASSSTTDSRILDLIDPL